MKAPKQQRKPKKLRINRKKLRKLSPSDNYFLSLLRAIIYQQISTKAGDAIYKRFFVLFNHTDPTPEKLLSLTDESLRTVGLSGQKVKYMRDLALRFKDGTIEPEKFPQMSDEEVIEHLTKVKGIGRWTAEMFLISALNRPNVLSLGDLGIKKGFMKAYGLKKLPSERKMLELAEPHKGAWTELCLHLWSILD